jgi:polar amino acid transport system substrate-binding protein
MRIASVAAALFCRAAVLWMVPAEAQEPAQVDRRVEDLVRAGRIRIGVFPSFQYSKDVVTSEPRGLAMGIARALAKRLGFSDVVVVEYAAPPQVIECVKTGRCDIGFMLIDPARATEVDFSPAFARSDFTYLVPASSLVGSAADADRPGMRIAVVRGHASTAALERILKRANPVAAETFESAVELLRSGNADAFASIREMLIVHSAGLPGSRVLADSYQSNFAGIAVPKDNPGRLAYVREFLEDLKGSGLLQSMIESAGLRGLEVVPSTTAK